MTALPSLAVEVTPEIPSTASRLSSIGSTTCFSTTSGEAPWYGASTDTMGSSMVGSSCCLSWGIAIAPKTSATIDMSPIRARCARLNLDSQDMDQGLSSVAERGTGHMAAPVAGDTGERPPQHPEPWTAPHP
ncbi:hypothetical protein SVIOM342S_10040 [Streptomyces violaceorubidus]